MHLYSVIPKQLWHCSQLCPVCGRGLLFPLLSRLFQPLSAKSRRFQQFVLHFSPLWLPNSSGCSRYRISWSKATPRPPSCWKHWYALFLLGPEKQNWGVLHFCYLSLSKCFCSALQNSPGSRSFWAHLWCLRLLQVIFLARLRNAPIFFIF